MEVKADVVHRSKAAKLFANFVDLEHQLAHRRFAAGTQWLCILPVHFAGWTRQFASDQRPDAIGHVLEHQDHGDTKHNHFITAAGANQGRQGDLQIVVEQFDQGGTYDGAPHIAHAANHGHEQVFDAHLQAKGGRIDSTLEVRKQPACDGCKQSRNQKDRDFVAEGADAHGLGHLGTAFERTNGTART